MKIYKLIGCLTISLSSLTYADLFSQNQNLITHEKIRGFQQETNQQMIRFNQEKNNNNLQLINQQISLIEKRESSNKEMALKAIEDAQRREQQTPTIIYIEQPKNPALELINSLPIMILRAALRF